VSRISDNRVPSFDGLPGNGFSSGFERTGHVFARSLHFPQGVPPIHGSIGPTRLTDGLFYRLVLMISRPSLWFFCASCSSFSLYLSSSGFSGPGFEISTPFLPCI